MQGGCNEVVKDAVRRPTRCRAGLYGVWAALWTGFVLALALGMAGTAYADNQYQPSLAGVVQGPTPWAEYNADEYYDGYLVYGANKYDCLIYALGLNPDDFDLVARGKLSKASTGGRFYEVLQKGYNDNCPPWVNITFYEGWLRQCGITPPSSTNPQWLWAFEIYSDEYREALYDAMTVRDGGDIDDGSGGGTVSGNHLTFTMNPVNAYYVNSEPPWNSAWYPYNGGKIYTMVKEEPTAPSINFDITLRNEIPIENATMYAYIEPRRDNYAYLRIYIGDDITYTTDTVQVDRAAIDNTKPAFAFSNYNKMTYAGHYIYISQRLSNITENNVLTNVAFTEYTGGAGNIVNNGNGIPLSGFYYSTDMDTGGDDDEPSDDPWPDPEPTTPTPQPPELPEPGDPTQPVEPTVPTPDPPTPPVIDYPTPTAPIQELPDVDSDDNFTVDLQGILDALNEHCIHLQTRMIECTEYLSSNLRWIIEWEGNQIISTIELMQRYLGNDLDYNFQTLIGDNHNLIEYLADRIGNDLATILDYLEDYTVWLDQKLDYQFPTFDDSSMVYWLKRLYYKKGTGTDSRPVDPVTDPFGIGDWLRNLANLLIQALEGLAPGLVGDLLEKIDLLTGKFPFSLPWDIMAVLGAFVAQPEAPSVEWPCYAYQNGQIVQVATYDVDMSAYDGVMEGVRFVGFLGFAVYTMTLIPKWVDDLTGVVESA